MVVTELMDLNFVLNKMMDQLKEPPHSIGRQTVLKLVKMGFDLGKNGQTEIEDWREVCARARLSNQDNEEN